MIGAIVGGALGVTGALIVAGSAIRRERRAASVMLQRDLLNVTAMVNTLTYHRKLTPPQVGHELLVKNLKFFRHRLSPLFEGQMALLSGNDLLLTSMLVGFHQCYAAVESYMQTIERVDPLTEEVGRSMLALPAMLEKADQYARAALYLLPLQEIGTFRQWYWRIRRRSFPDQEDNAMQALMAQLQKPQSAKEGN